MLRLASEAGGRLATIVGIEGGFSRAVGSQLAVAGERMAGDLSDHCLEAAVATELAKDAPRRVLRYGEGSPAIDIRLPCGGAIDILIDPAPDRALLSAALTELTHRRPFAIAMPLCESGTMRLLGEGEEVPEGTHARRYVPQCRLLLFGQGGEARALVRIGEAAGFPALVCAPKGVDGDAPLTLGEAPAHIAADRWSAIVLLFHDHEWERTVLPWALSTDAFYIGALGSTRTREARDAWLRGEGFADDDIAAVRGPIGLVPALRTPETVAVSVLAEIVAAYRDRFGR